MGDDRIMTTKEKLERANIHVEDRDTIENLSLLATEVFAKTLPGDLTDDQIWDEKVKYRAGYVDAMIDQAHVNVGIGLKRLKVG